MTQTKKEKSITRFFPFITSVLVPFYPLLYLYTQNAQYLSISHVLICGSLFALFTAVVFLAAKKITRSPFGGMVFCILLWVVYFSTSKIAPTLALRNRYALLISGFLLIIALVIIKLTVNKLNPSISQTFTTFIFAVTVFLVMFNAVLSVIRYIELGSEKNIDQSVYKTVFTVEPVLSAPNIYWFHTDGMLGFDSMERFFGDEQENFTQELENRGFWINRDAAFDGGRSTQTALPALMSPHFYDRAMSWEYDFEYAKSIPQNQDPVNNHRNRPELNFTTLRGAREKNELIAAFGNADYNTITVAGVGIYFYPTVHKFYNYTDVLSPKNSNAKQQEYINEISNLRGLFELIGITEFLPESVTLRLFNKLMTMGFVQEDVLSHGFDLYTELELTANEESRRLLTSYNYIAESILASMMQTRPRFTTIVHNMPHRPFVWDENGNHNEEDADNPLRYPAHHKFSADVLLKYIDMILEDDPDAVIVLQADHGLHGLLQFYTTEELMEIFSCTEEETKALWNSVMSAVRIPVEQMTPEVVEILQDPRNISRWLVNTYVGENYDYIPPEFKQEFKGPEK
ncbi:MAG: hypothetical protein FWG70_06540 [Oscillospiraceae bacterium]|nr:hypothetical protein [Oscillospiraceae bacterium]